MSFALCCFLLCHRFLLSNQPDFAPSSTTFSDLLLLFSLLHFTHPCTKEKLKLIPYFLYPMALPLTYFFYHSAIHSMKLIPLMITTSLLSASLLFFLQNCKTAVSQFASVSLREWRGWRSSYQHQILQVPAQKLVPASSVDTWLAIIIRNNIIMLGNKGSGKITLWEKDNFPWGTDS